MIALFGQQALALLISPVVLTLLTIACWNASSPWAGRIAGLLIAIATLLAAPAGGWTLPALFPNGFRVARLLWILPLASFCIVFVLEANHFGLEYAIAGYITGNQRVVGGEGAIGMIFLTLPVYSSVGYATGATVKCRRLKGLCLSKREDAPPSIVSGC